jgi:hypothetical protein
MLARFGMLLITSVVGITLYRPLDGRRDGGRRAGVLGDRRFDLAGHPHAASIVRAHAAPAATAWSFCHFFDIVSGL